MKWDPCITLKWIYNEDAHCTVFTGLMYCLTSCIAALQNCNPAHISFNLFVLGSI